MQAIKYSPATVSDFFNHPTVSARVIKTVDGTVVHKRTNMVMSLELIGDHFHAVAYPGVSKKQRKNRKKNKQRRNKWYQKTKMVDDIQYLYREHWYILLRKDALPALYKGNQVVKVIQKVSMNTYFNRWYNSSTKQSVYDTLSNNLLFEIHVQTSNVHDKLIVIDEDTNDEDTNDEVMTCNEVMTCKSFIISSTSSFHDHVREKALLCHIYVTQCSCTLCQQQYLSRYDSDIKNPAHDMFLCPCHNCNWLKLAYCWLPHVKELYTKTRLFIVNYNNTSYFFKLR